MNDWQKILLGAFLAIIATGVIYLIAIPPRGHPIELLPPPTPAPLVVHIAGAVVKPGVYSLPSGSRVQDVVQAAGGLLDNADSQGINLAAPLRDGEQVSIARLGDAAPTMAAPLPPNRSAGSMEIDKTAPAIAYPINLNTATLEELDALPGIGASKAQAILNYRQKNGPFRRIEDIQKVTGIGPGIFAQIKTLIAVE